MEPGKTNQVLGYVLTVSNQVIFLDNAQIKRKIRKILELALLFQTITILYQKLNVLHVKKDSIELKIVNLNFIEMDIPWKII